MSEKDSKYNLENGYMSIHEILAKNGVNQRKLVNEIDRLEMVDNTETHDVIVNKIKENLNKTDLNKKQFISEISSGLGLTIKKAPNTINYIKNPKLLKIKKFFIKIFTKF